MAITDWLWWCLAGALGLGGFTLMLWALLGDRSRGRRRCPHCWYDMTGAPSLVCSECGTNIRSERRLFRTRRHWRKAALAALLLLASLAAFETQQVIKYGWVKATPTIAYIAFLPSLDPNTTFAELVDRVSANTLRDWEYRLLVHRCIGVLRGDRKSPLLDKTAQLLGRIETLESPAGTFRPARRPGKVSKVDHEGAIAALVDLLEHDDPTVRSAAVNTIRRFGDGGIPAIPALLGRLTDDDAHMRLQTAIALLFGYRLGLSEPVCPFAWLGDEYAPAPGADEARFLQSLGTCRIDRDSANARFRQGLTHPLPAIRAFSVAGLALLSDGDADDRNRILDLAQDESELVRWTVAMVAALFPLDERVRGILEHAMLEESEPMRFVALYVAGIRGREGADFLATVGPMMKECELATVDNLEKMYLSAGGPAESLQGAQRKEILERLRIARLRGVGSHSFSQLVGCFVRIGGNREEAIEMLIAELQRPEHDRSFPRDAVLLDMARIGGSSPTACDAIQPWLMNSDPAIKFAAAVAIVRLGGDRDLVTRTMIDVLRSPAAKTQSGCPAFASWLARSGRASIPAIQELLTSDVAADRSLAARLLRITGGHGVSALPELRRVANDADPAVAAAAQSAIQAIELDAQMHRQSSEKESDWLDTEEWSWLRLPIDVPHLD